MKAHPLTSTPNKYSRTRTALAVALFLAAAVLTAALTGGCKSPPPPQAKSKTLPVNSFRKDWSMSLNNRDPVTALHVRGDQLYVYTRAGRSVTFRRDTGAIHTSYVVKNARVDFHPPVVLRDFVVYPTPTALQVYARDGRFLRTISFPFAIRTDAVGTGTNVYFGADYPNRGGGRMVRADVSRDLAPVRWDFRAVSGGFDAPPALVEPDALYFAGLDGKVYALDASSREPIWGIPGYTFNTGGPIRAGITADANNVYAASTDSILYVINRNSGQRRWQYFAGVPLEDAPVVTADRVYQRVRGRGMVVLSKEPVAAGDTKRGHDRTPMWTADRAKQFLAQDERHAYLLHEDNSIVAHDKTTGEERFRTRRKNLTRFATNTVDTNIYAATSDGRVIGIKPVLQPGVVGEMVMEMDLGEPSGRERKEREVAAR